jgi:hypothetical protein
VLKTHLLPPMKRPPYSLLGDRAGELQKDDKGFSARDEYLLSGWN